jgi:hypothetical protein
VAVQPAKCPGRHTVTLLTIGPSHGMVRRTSNSTLAGFTASTFLTYVPPAPTLAVAPFSARAVALCCLFFYRP